MLIARAILPMNAPAIPDKYWIPAGRSVSVAGTTIPDGMVYVGSGLRSLKGGRQEPALIDPTLPVDMDNAGWDVDDIDIACSYSFISPKARGAYLKWLMQGKKDPYVPIGCVFLYFFGLERRVVADHKVSGAAISEKGNLVAEVNRLLTTYGSDWMFSNYANALIDIASILRPVRPIYMESAPDWMLNQAPMKLRFGLSMLSNDVKAIPPEWALAWLESGELYNSRTPSKRCRAEFKKLFSIRLSQKFPKGYIVKPSKKGIKTSYNPASASFGGPINIKTEKLSDVMRREKPVRDFAEVADRCEDDLDAYSRHIGRAPEDRDSLAAISLLPVEMVQDHDSEKAATLRKWLCNLLGIADSAVADFSELAGKTGVPEDIDKKNAMALSRILSAFGYGMEPDIRFSGMMPAPEMKVIVFKLSKDSPSAPSPELAAGMVVLYLSAAVAHADRVIKEEEERHMALRLESMMGMTAGEKARLDAHLQWALLSPPPLSGLKRKLADLEPERRAELGRFLISVANADGYISPEEIDMLAKIYRALGLDEKEIYSHAHAVASEPVTIIEPLPVTEYAIPQPPGIALNMALVEHKMHETRAVSTLLSAIFGEPEEPESMVAVMEEPGMSIVGLDGEHSDFLMALSARSSWSRDELEALAEEKRILLNGALDTINDAAYEKCGAPLFDGDDPVEIDPEVLKEMMT